jgi:hypothetical protein
MFQKEIEHQRDQDSQVEDSATKDIRISIQAREELSLVRIEVLMKIHMETMLEETPISAISP